MHHFWYNEVTCVNYQDWQYKNVFILRYHSIQSWTAIMYSRWRTNLMQITPIDRQENEKTQKRLLLMKHVSDSSVFFFMNPSNTTWILSFVPPEQSWNFLISITLIRLQRSFRQVCSGDLSRFSKKTRRPPRVIHIFETIFWLGNQQHNSFDFVTCGLRGKCRVQLVPVEIVVRTSQ